MANTGSVAADNPRLSLCCTPRQRSCSWHAYWDINHTDIQYIQAWIRSLPNAIRPMVKKRYESFLDRGSKGMLNPESDPADIGPVSSFPGMYETRQMWHPRMSVVSGFNPRKLPAGSVLVRQYHIESVSAEKLVPLHIHFKDISSDDEHIIRFLQNQAMLQADSRRKSLSQAKPPIMYSNPVTDLF